jgi:hypothetical protein
MRVARMKKNDNNKDGCNEKISRTCNQKSNQYKDDEDDDNDGTNDSESTNDDVNNDDDYNTSDQDDDKDSSEDEAKYSAKKKRKIIGQKKKKNSSSDDEQVPHEYMFNSYMAYVLWGPFAEDTKKLPLFLLGKCQCHSIMNYLTDRYLTSYIILILYR